MDLTGRQMRSEADIERLLGALRGVRSSRVIMASDGRIVEIHVLSTPDFHPKQVVRNVESALSAALRLDVDRRIISVSQLETEMPPPRAEEPAPEAAAPPPAATSGEGPASRAGTGATRQPAMPASRRSDALPATRPPSGLVIPLRPAPAGPAERVRFAGIRTHTRASLSIACEVRLTLDGTDYVGREEAPDTESGRLGAAARATFAALEAALGEAPAALESVSAVDADAGRYALVMARGYAGRERVPLVGTARIRSAPEDAAVLATLQALDRWLTSDLAG